MFEKLMQYEFQLSKTAETILRANSLGTKTTDLIIKDLTPEWIAKVLKSLIQKTVSAKLDLEVDKK
jgi:hypothetical protein